MFKLLTFIFNFLLGRRSTEDVQDEIVYSDSKNYHWGDPPKDIFSALWQPMLVNPNGIIVRWKEKYGPEKEMKCIGIWKNTDTDDYMLTWKDSRKVIIENNNITDLDYENDGEGK